MILEYIISIAALLIFAGVFILPAVYLLFGKIRERRRETEQEEIEAGLMSVPPLNGDFTPAAEKHSRELMDHIDEFSSGSLSSSLKERYEGWDSHGGDTAASPAGRRISRLNSLPELKKAVVMAELLGPPKALRQD